MIRFRIALAILATAFLISSPAEARHRHHYRHYSHRSVGTPVAIDVAATPAYGWGSSAAAIDANGNRAPRCASRGDFSYISNPAGCGRTVASCACRLAAYWGLGSGLDAVRTWPKRYARASGPGVGIAAVRRDLHHIIGIVGGGPGGYRVVDFNSGGHLNREYVVSDFRGYFFVDPHQPRMANR